jgi:two-component system response regulator AtoC
VRELQNVIQRVMLLSDGTVIDGAALRDWLCPTSAHQGPIATATATEAAASDPIGELVGQKLADVEEELIRRTFDYCKGNRTRTAETLGIGVRTLFNKLKTEAPVETVR